MYDLLALVRDGGEEDDADGACRRAGRPRLGLGQLRHCFAQLTG